MSKMPKNNSFSTKWNLGTEEGMIKEGKFELEPEIGKDSFGLGNGK